MRYTLSEYKKIIEDIQEKDPALIEETYDRIKKIDPHYRYLFTLTDVLRVYCEKRSLAYVNNNEHALRGVGMPQNLKQERLTFIAVALWLFSPNTFKIAKRKVKIKAREEFKRHTVPIYMVEDGIRHHLAGILGCHESKISKLVNPIACAYHERNTDFKNVVDNLVRLIKSEVKEEVVEMEPITQQ